MSWPRPVQASRGRAGKSKPTKAAAGSPVASRAKRGPQGDAPPPDLKAPRTKSRSAANRAAGAQGGGRAQSANLGASVEGKAIGSSAARRLSGDTPAEIQTAPVPPEPIRSAARAQPPEPARDARRRLFPTQAANEGAQYSAPDVEALAHNIAQAIEQGGKALAAYLRRGQSGEIKATLADEIGEMVRSIGRVAEYYMADPQRAFAAQTALTKQFVDLWASTLQRLQGEQAPPVAAPDVKPTSASPTPRGATIRISTSSSRPTC